MEASWSVTLKCPAAPNVYIRRRAGNACAGVAWERDSLMGDSPSPVLISQSFRVASIEEHSTVGSLAFLLVLFGCKSRFAGLAAGKISESPLIS